MSTTRGGFGGGGGGGGGGGVGDSPFGNAHDFFTIGINHNYGVWETQHTGLTWRIWHIWKWPFPRLS